MTSEEHKLILNNLRNKLEKNSVIYPEGCCEEAAICVKQELRFSIINGYFKNGDNSEYHVWNYNPNSQEIVDITADQFDTSLPGVYITKNDERYVEVVK